MRIGVSSRYLGGRLSLLFVTHGRRGLGEMTDLLADEVSITLAQLGLNDIKDVTPEAVARISNGWGQINCWSGRPTFAIPVSPRPAQR